MAKNTVNDKSKQISIRIPHDVIDGMETLKRPDESNAGFIVTAMRGEIARRQFGGSACDDLASAIDTLTSIETISAKAGKEIETITSAARQKIEQLRSKSANKQEALNPEPPVKSPKSPKKE